MIRRLSPSELPAAAALAAAAFREDPGLAFVIPDDAQRRRLLPALFAASIAVDLRAGARVLGAYEDGALVGLSSWRATGQETPGLSAWLPHAPSLWRLYADPRRVLRAALLTRTARSPLLKGRGRARLLAVHPTCAGRGVGAALLADMLSEGPLYLETFEPASRRWCAARGLTELAERRAAGVPPFWAFRS